jgi:glycosyltransferase involved in cell wall biosynthesis
MRIVVISSYPPRHCGIGAYAAEQVRRDRKAGHEVTVISPPDGDGDLRVEFTGGRPFRLASRIGRGADRIVIHFQPALYYAPRAPVSKVATSMALLELCRRRPQTEIVVHEADKPKRWRPDYVLLRAAFRAASVLLFHTERERGELERAYGIEVRARLIPHGDGVRLHGTWTRETARERVGVPAKETLFVAPGFIHPDKGLDRAAEAVSRAGTGRLVILGSIKDPTPRNLAYVESLRVLVAGAPNVGIIERYVTDEEFDAWLAAADAVVLAYRRSWSSGALARAQRLGTPAVVTAVGGLGEQASDRDVVVRDDQELAAALAEIASRRHDSTAAR